MKGFIRVHNNANQISTEEFEKLVFLREISEPAVWTDRMLTTLVKGVKRGKWYSLADKIFTAGNIKISTDKVLKNDGGAGVDLITAERYSLNRDHFDEKLQTELRKDMYSPKPVKRIYIPKAGGKGKRPLGIPTIKDRIAQKAVLNVIAPIFEKDFSDNSYGFRPKKSCKDALREVDKLLKEGFNYVLDADIKGYFDNISHEIVLNLVSDKITDSRVLNLINSFLKQDIIDELKHWTPEGGTPQGGIISPLLANVYLDGLDKLMEKKGFRMIRYADDFVILCRTEAETETALKHVVQWMSEMKLTLSAEKTKTVDMHKEGADFVFLGYRFFNHKNRIKRVPSQRSYRKLKDSIRLLTKRNNGKSMPRIMKDINPVLRGWFEYYKHSWHYVFPTVDGWTRTRLRSILKRRQKKRGIAKSSTHVKWNNKFFEGFGFFSLEVACNSYRQSLWSNC